MSPNTLGMSNYSRTNLGPTIGFLKKFGMKILRVEIIEICEFAFPTFRGKKCTNLWTRSVISDNYFYEINLRIEIDTGGSRGSVDAVATCYGLDGPGIELWQRKIFPSPCPLGVSLRSIQPRLQLIPHSFLEVRPLDRGVSTLPPHNRRRS